MTTYVYEDTEVKKTGRSATKKLRSGRDDILYEITPVAEAQGVWKKWVRESELFDIAAQESNK